MNALAIVVIAAGFVVAARAISSPLRPLPDDAAGAAIVTDTATEIGLMTPEKMQARLGSKTAQDLDLGRLVKALRGKGYNPTAAQLSSMRVLLGKWLA